MKKPLRLSCLLTTLLLACGRTGVGKSTHLDAGKDEGRDQVEVSAQDAASVLDSTLGSDSSIDSVGNGSDDQRDLSDAGRTAGGLLGGR